MIRIYSEMRLRVGRFGNEKQNVAIHIVPINRTESSERRQSNV